MTDVQADRMAARATGVGIGLIVLMLAWIVGNRVSSLLWDAPAGPIVALSTALVLGAIATAVSTRRLRATLASSTDERNGGT